MQCKWSQGYGKRCDCINDLSTIYADTNVLLMPGVMQDLECDCKRILLICTQKCMPLVKVYLTLNWSSNMPISCHWRFLTTILYTVEIYHLKFNNNTLNRWNISLKIQNSIFLHLKWFTYPKIFLIYFFIWYLLLIERLITLILIER